MSKFKKIMGVLALALCVTVTTPAIVPTTSNVTTVEAAKVKLSKTKATLIKGQTLTLKVNNTSKKVTWSSSNKSIAAVNKSGKISAKKAGTATITAKVSGKKYTCKITVEQPKISQSTLSVEKGKTATLSVTGNTQKVKWSTSNKAIATVSSKGVVTGKKLGKAKITATVSGKKYTCTVTVKAVSAVGTQANPLSAYNANTIELYDYNRPLGKIQLQLKQCITGAEAEALVSTSYKKFLTVPAGHQWVYMVFSLKYISGTKEIDTLDVLWYNQFYNTAANKQVSSYAIGRTPESDLINLSDLSLYPSGSTDFYLIFTAPKEDFPLTFRMDTGYDTKNYSRTYTWFTTKQ
ncbi:Ig-like domain-containing protein [Konateibacter massiliensis]|uniref:Ig-like domain-containing protein n=1 Tax=Konateibacter massiliensis TaxID=2002841 RepID=UPI001F30B6E4|nr:Ig-like domain-containing protein [Konateibacter massiliensis]